MIDDLKEKYALKKQPKKDKEVKAKEPIDLKPIFTLDEEGEKLFYRVVQYLEKSDLIAEVDVITVTMLAKSLALYITCAREVHDYDDMVQVYQNGSSNVSGAFTALSKAQDQVLKLSAKLGLSPMDRTRIMGAVNNVESSKTKSAEGDAIDQLL